MLPLDRLDPGDMQIWTIRDVLRFNLLDGQAVRLAVCVLDRDVRERTLELEVGSNYPVITRNCEIVRQGRR